MIASLEFALAVIGAIVIAGGIGGALQDRFELLGWRPVRRWYGMGAQVQLRGDTPDGSPDYEVLDWDHESGRYYDNPPWVKVITCNADEGDESLWVPVTVLRPVSVRVLRPSLRQRCVFQQRPVNGAAEQEVAA